MLCEWGHIGFIQLRETGNESSLLRVTNNYICWLFFDSKCFCAQMPVKRQLITLFCITVLNLSVVFSVQGLQMHFTQLWCNYLNWNSLSKINDLFMVTLPSSFVLSTIHTNFFYTVAQDNTLVTSTIFCNVLNNSTGDLHTSIIFSLNAS